MARQEIDIGVEGNDGTGDSIRESFKKVNTNFQELYAVFGLGGSISFKNLDDTPDSYLANQFAVTAINSTETQIQFYKFVSDSGLNNNDKSSPSETTNSVFVEFDDVDPATPDLSGTIKISIVDPHINRDPDPNLTAPLNMEAPIAYSSVVNTKLRNTGAGDNINTLVTEWENVHTGAPAISVDNLVISKGYADDTYVNVAGDTMTGALSVPSGATGAQVPQTQEVITRAGSVANRTMLDELYLNDHPYPLAGAGTPNGPDDLLAVSKLYVDTQGFSSSTNLYVATTGDDAQTLTPAGQEGRSPQYAYKSVSKAMQRATQIIEATPIEPGPYIQVVTHSQKKFNSTILSTAGFTASIATADVASNTAIDNIEVAQEAVVDYLTATYPDFIYDKIICQRDAKLMIDSVRLDVQQGLSANYLTRWAAIRYNASPSAIKARTLQLTQTVESIGIIKTTIVDAFNALNTATPGSISASVITAYQNRFDEIISILNNGGDIPGAITQNDGTEYVFNFDNGNNSAVDQGVVGNPDLREGKVIVGRTSGAKGIITDYVRNQDVGISDRVSIQLLEPIEFQIGEELEFGARTRSNQITVRVESGIYFEHLPIKLPENVSIKGDEFRRVVIRPKPGVSQSPWAPTYFYRDINVDGLIAAYSPIATINNVSGADVSRAAGTYAIGADDWSSPGIGQDATFSVVVDGSGAATVTVTNAGDGFIQGETITINDSDLGAGGGANLTFDVATTGGGYNFTHPITGIQGKYGRHYMTDPSEDIQIGTDASSNPGNFDDAARLIELNKDFLVEETIAFVNNTYPAPGFTYNEAKCRRDTRLIIDGIVNDLRIGGRENTLTNQGAYYAGAVSGQETETEAAILHLKPVITNILANDSGNGFVVTTGNTEPQVFDEDYAAETNAETNALELVDCVAFAFDPAYNPPLNNSEMDVFLCNDGTIVRNITVQRHGGFMMTLDPEGQILTRSPYCQTGTSFSQSKGVARSFAGGLFIDGYASNMPADIIGKTDNFNLQVQSPNGEGLYIRKPETPFPFFKDGARYQVNVIKDWDQATGTATLVLDETSNPSSVFTRNITSITNADPAVITTTVAHGLVDGDAITITGVSGMTDVNGNTYYVNAPTTTTLQLYIDEDRTASVDSTGFGTHTAGTGIVRALATGRGYTATIPGVPPYDSIFLQSGGNRSMLANDFTQINDLGYGALLTNNALAELVSMFTYYCHTGYMADKGSQIRSLSGNNSYGFYGLVAAGADPDEIPTDVTLADDMVFPAKVFRSAGYLDFASATPGTVVADQLLSQGAINASITSTSTTNPVRVTATAHGLSSNDVVTISSVTGMIELNGRTFYISVIDANNFDLYIDSGLTNGEDGTAYSAGTGGLASKSATATAKISFKGEGNKRLYLYDITGTFNTTETCTTPTGSAGIPSSFTSQEYDADTGALKVFAYDLSGYPLNVSEAEIYHGSGLYQPYEITNANGEDFRLGSYSFDATDYATVVTGGTATPSTNAQLTITKTRTDGYGVIVDDGGGGYAQGETIVIDGQYLGGATSTNDVTITIDSVSSGAIVTASVTTGVAQLDDSTPIIDGKVWTFNLGTGIEGTAENGLQEATLHDNRIVVRHKQNFVLDNFPEEELPVRPSTAFVFTDDTTDYTYRTIAFTTTITGGVNATGDQKVVTFDANFRYIDLVVDSAICGVTEVFFNSNSTVDPNYTDIVGTASSPAPSSLITLGNTAATTSTDGSRFIAISPLDSTDQARIAGGEMLVSWGGKTYTIDAYAEYDFSGATHASFGNVTRTVGIIEITEVANSDINFPQLSGSVYGGLGAALYTGTNGAGITLKGGLAGGEEAEITVNISTCRATGHDMLDIGVGGFNTANYPERIYGQPFGYEAVSTNDAIDSTGNKSAAQTQERNKGRVFSVLTDQDGFFRVGRFFTVDQGTGAVTFNAALVLTNIDGIGFKRGVRVNEFSNDDTFTDAKGDAVPTQTAVEGYINARLGFDRDGATGVSTIGPGVMSLGGPGYSETPMNGNLNVGSNRVINVSDPLALSDAATKNYVDNKTDELNDIGDVTITGAGNTIQAQILGFTGQGSVTDQLSENMAVTGDIGLTYDPLIPNTITAAISSGVIVNGDISATAAIDQSKLNMTIATATAAAPTGDAAAIQAASGLASFDSANFEITDGWVGIKANGVSNAELANSSITIGSTSISLGGTATSIADMTGIDFASGVLGGTFTINLDDGANTVFSVDSSGNILGPANTSGNATGDNAVSIGGSLNRYNTVWATTFNGEATSALYADLAENYLGDADYEPGTVLVFGGEQEVTVCTAKGQTSVAGVVTTNPAHLMNSALEGDNVVGLALTGRVPCKVIGRVQKGDMLVTSAVPGYAIVNNSPGVGQVIGKAVGVKDHEDRGIVEVVIGRV